MTTINDPDGGTEQPAQESIFLTFICQRPMVSAGAFTALLAAAAGLLAELDRALHGSTTLDWSVAAVLTGHSEYLDTARVAVELIGQPLSTADRRKASGAGMYPALVAGLHEIRTAASLPAGFAVPVLACVLELADTLHGEVSELWFSQSGVTPVFITLDTWHNAKDCLARLDPGFADLPSTSNPA